MSTSTDLMNSRPKLNLTDSRTHHDRVLIVGEKKFYVLSGILILWSEHFRGLFSDHFAEGRKKEIEIKDVEPQIFEAFLNILYDTSNDSCLYTDNVLVSMIEMSYRFLAPRVLYACIDFFSQNNTMFTSKLFDTAWTYNITDLMEILKECLRHPEDIEENDVCGIYECVIKHNITEMQEHIDDNLRYVVTPNNCGGLLDIAKKYELPNFKIKVVDVMSTWNGQKDISNERIIKLVATALEHDLSFLKKLLREHIFYYSPSTRLLNAEARYITINNFLKLNLDTILALPTDQRDFIIKSTFSPNVNDFVPLEFPVV